MFKHALHSHEYLVFLGKCCPEKHLLGGTLGTVMKHLFGEENTLIFLAILSLLYRSPARLLFDHNQNFWRSDGNRRPVSDHWSSSDAIEKPRPRRSCHVIKYTINAGAVPTLGSQTSPRRLLPAMSVCWRSITTPFERADDSTPVEIIVLPCPRGERRRRPRSSGQCS